MKGKISNGDCYGEKKKGVVENNYLFPLMQLKLLNGQEKQGCCGKLTEHYYLFAYRNIDDDSIKGTFFVGSDCASQIIELLSEIKGAKDRLSLPPIFNIASGGLITTTQPMLKINKEALTVIHLIATLWDAPIYGSLEYIMLWIKKNPNTAISDKSIVSINNIFGRDRAIANGSCRNMQDQLQLLRNKEKEVGCFAFAELYGKLEQFKNDGIITDNYIG